MFLWDAAPPQLVTGGSVTATEVVPHLIRKETSAFGTADTLDSNSIKLCWQSHAKIYRILDKKFWTHSTNRKLVQEVCMLYTKHCLLQQKLVTGCIEFPCSKMHWKLLNANPYFTDIIIL
jgi:hypothetical protein